MLNFQSSVDTKFKTISISSETFKGTIIAYLVTRKNNTDSYR